MISDYIVTEATASQDGDPEVRDPVAVAYWPTDTHSVRRILRDGRVHNEGFIFKDGHRWRPFGIAYRALLPKGEGATNFVSLTCPSSSPVGYGEYIHSVFPCFPTLSCSFCWLTKFARGSAAGASILRAWAGCC